MPAPSLFRKWLVACVLAVVAVMLAALLLLRRPTVGPVPPSAPPTEMAEAAACGLPPFETVRARPDAESPPVILWASGEVRLYLDDEAAFSPPESPRHFPVGEHTLRVEADGYEPFSLRLRFDAWTPALLHAELDPVGGLTLVRLNAHCVSCPMALQEFEQIAVLPREGRGEDDPLGEAAAALRRGDWLTAMKALEQVPEAQRGTPLFHRLASVVFVDTRATEAARELLRTVPGSRGRELRALIDRQEALFQEEAVRRREVQLHRWNRATERYGALVGRYGVELPRTAGEAGSRLEALSATFSTHHEEGDVLGAEEALLAAEDELLRLARRLRASRPGDCAFQSDVVRMATTG